MPYILRKMVLAQVPTVEIAKSEYDSVKPARAVINELIAIEEKFDAVMENYVELEQTVHNLGIRELAFVDIHYEELVAPLNLVSRRVSNLLSSTRTYRDALPQHAARLLGKNHPAVQPLKGLSRDNPGHPMAYRQMEAARNYAQHVGPPISNVTFRRHKDLDEQKKTTGFSFSVVPHMDADAISKTRDMAPDLRASLKALGEDVNPMPIIRKYIEHIGTIHVGLRETVKEMEVKSESVMRDLLKRYAAVAPEEKLMGVAACFQNPNGSFANPEYLVEQRLDYFTYLRIKHLTAANLSMRYVPW
jgi:hypothetical protein